MLGLDGAVAEAAGVGGAGGPCCAKTEAGNAGTTKANTNATLKGYLLVRPETNGDKLAISKGNQPGIERQAREREARGEKPPAERRRKR